jgi:hypothetical protein
VTPGELGILVLLDIPAHKVIREILAIPVQLDLRVIVVPLVLLDQPDLLDIVARVVLLDTLAIQVILVPQVLGELPPVNKLPK